MTKKSTCIKHLSLIEPLIGKLEWLTIKCAINRKEYDNAKSMIEQACIRNSRIIKRGKLVAQQHAPLHNSDRRGRLYDRELFRSNMVKFTKERQKLNKSPQ
jgi:hypothetical protein